MEIQYREMVKQGPSLTSTIYFNWQPMTQFSFHCGITGTHWFSCMSTGVQARGEVPDIIMWKLGEIAADALGFDT